MLGLFKSGNWYSTIYIQFVISMFFVSCESASLPDGNAIVVRWEVVSNTHRDEPAVKAIFTLTNNSRFALNSENWELYFNQAARPLHKVDYEQDAEVIRISGDWYVVKPKAGFVLKPGETQSVVYECKYWLIKESDSPRGLYFVFNPGKPDQEIVPVENYQPDAFERPEQLSRHRNDQTPLPSPEWVFAQNASLHKVEPGHLLPLIPTPKSMIRSGTQFGFSEPLSIYHHPNLRTEALYLQKMLESLTGTAVALQEGFSGQSHAVDLVLEETQSQGFGSEAYSLEIGSNGNIRISGAANAGVFYGIQSLIALMSADMFLNPKPAFSLETLKINDAPRFGYRGVHVDVARNFQTKETIMKLIDILSFYKINTLHFSLTNDEGWRIEIPGLPELTEVGSKRLHTTKNAHALHPSYGSGPFADAPANHGCGFYTSRDIVEILQHATRRHVRIIPEINLPGHSRAAIKTMEARYEHYLGLGNLEAAQEFRLIDPDDTSAYLSAQYFDDNVVNVAGSGTYRFLEKVVDALMVMYREAGLQLETLHIGGDEVPKGAWMGSPEVQKMRAENGIGSSTVDVHAWFTKQALKILEARGITMAGWEEVALLKDVGGIYFPNPEFSGGRMIPYVWNNLWGSQDLAYRLANRDFPVVLCHVTNFYFDLAYDKSPSEPGLYWGGFVDTRKAWYYSPYDVFSTTLADQMGVPIDTETEYRNMERLRPEARKNILGLQAQLWSECIHGSEMLEYALLPKLTGLAESAWAQERIWERTTEPTLHLRQVEETWNIFSNTLAQREMPRLAGIFGRLTYRIPPPGALVINDSLYANTGFPGLNIRFTTDGSEPNTGSEKWIKPIRVSNNLIKLKAFDEAGKGSRTVAVKSPKS